MHCVQVVEGGIDSRDGSKHRQCIVPMRLFDTPDQQSHLYVMTSSDVGDQQGPSTTTTSQDVREDNTIECEVVILEQYMWLVGDHFPLASWWTNTVLQ